MSIISSHQASKIDIQSHIDTAILLIYGKIGMCSIAYSIMQCNAANVTIKAEKE